MVAHLEDTDLANRDDEPLQLAVEGWDMLQALITRRRSALAGGPRTALSTIGRAAMAYAYEVVLMAAVAATLPRNLVNPNSGGFEAESAPPPAKAHTASVRRPVLLVHGLGGGKSSWSLVARTLSGRGLVVNAITYGPFGTSVEQLADRLVGEVERILAATGADKIHLLGHSLGGVVIAQAIAGGRLNGRVDTVVTIASPFGGSPWANLFPFGAIVRALRQDSPLLRRLASAPAPDGVRWLAFTAALDVIVPSLRSVPVHARVETVNVRGVGHLGMLLNKQAVGLIANALSA